MSAAVAHSHGAGDLPRPPLRQISLGCRGVGGRKATRGGMGGERDEGRKGVREATKNIVLKKSVEEYGLQEILFE
ncbi:hypothetical protein Tco_1276781 [Tanacetum coccineum]